MKNEQLPIVSCIMPTRGRPSFVEQSILYFSNQDYPNRELIIIYDEESDIPAVREEREDVIFLKVPKNSSIGHKRNKGCEIAKGEIVAHWDDDDWFGPTRLSEQVQPIANDEADITGLNNHLFLDLDKMVFWSCSSNLYKQMFMEGVQGGSIIYRKRYWSEYGGYGDYSLREDADLMAGMMKDGARLKRIGGKDLYVYLRHGNNSWSFLVGDFLSPEEWQAVEMPELFQDAAHFYQNIYDKKIEARQQRLESEPPVSCILFNPNNRESLQKTIKNFEDQSYANKELLVIGEENRDAFESHSDIHFLSFNDSSSKAAGWNLGCEQAKGELLLHWSADDWRDNNWIPEQVKHLIVENADITGLAQPLVYYPHKDSAWQFIYPDNNNAPWIHENTFCYRKEFWKKHRFFEAGERTAESFLKCAAPQKVSPHKMINSYVIIDPYREEEPNSLLDARWMPYELTTVKQILKLL